MNEGKKSVAMGDPIRILYESLHWFGFSLCIKMSIRFISEDSFLGRFSEHRGRDRSHPICPPYFLRSRRAYPYAVLRSEC